MIFRKALDRLGKQLSKDGNMKIYLAEKELIDRINYTWLAWSLLSVFSMKYWIEIQHLKINWTKSFNLKVWFGLILAVAWSLSCASILSTPRPTAVVCMHFVMRHCLALYIASCSAVWLWDSSEPLQQFAVWGVQCASALCSTAPYAAESTHNLQYQCSAARRVHLGSACSGCQGRGSNKGLQGCNFSSQLFYQYYWAPQMESGPTFCVGCE